MADDNDPLVQMNVRIPQSVRDAADARRNQLGLSQSQWIANLILWGLQQPPGTPADGRRRRPATASSDGTINGVYSPPSVRSPEPDSVPTADAS